MKQFPSCFFNLFLDNKTEQLRLLQVLQMESSVLNYLKFEMTAPTAKCFLR